MTDEIWDGTIELRIMNDGTGIFVRVVPPENIDDMEPERVADTFIAGAASMLAGIVDAGMEGEPLIDRSEVLGAFFAKAMEGAFEMLDK